MTERGTAANSDERSTRTVDRALALLLSVTRHVEGATMSELAREASLSPSTASRLLTTLETHGMVGRDSSGKYGVGTQLIQIAANVLRELPLYQLAGPFLAALADQTGETANLGIPSGDDRVLYLRQTRSPNLVQTAVWTGRTVPVDGTAIGAAIRGRVNGEGFSVVRGAIEPDVTGVAAPVLSHDGDIVAALSVIAPTYRTSDDDVSNHGRALVEHAGQLSLKLGVAPNLVEAAPSRQHELSRP